MPRLTPPINAAREAAIRVLVVEDDHAAAQGLAELLRVWGYEAFVASDGETALEMASRLRPDISIVDLGLPGMDGGALVERLRAGAGSATMVMISLTGYGEGAEPAGVRTVQFDYRLRKPVDLGTLQRLLTASVSG